MKYSIADCMHISQMKYWRKYEALDLIYKNHNSTINECFQLLVLGHNKTNYFQPQGVEIHFISHYSMLQHLFLHHPFIPLYSVLIKSSMLKHIGTIRSL